MTEKYDHSSKNTNVRILYKKDANGNDIIPSKLQTFFYCLALPVIFPVQTVISIFQERHYFYGMIAEAKLTRAENKVMKDWSEEDRRKFFELKHDVWLKSQGESYYNMMKGIK